MVALKKKSSRDGRLSAIADETTDQAKERVKQWLISSQRGEEKRAVG